jgi:hypothetical protein
MDMATVVDDFEEIKSPHRGAEGLIRSAPFWVRLRRSGALSAALSCTNLLVLILGTMPIVGF